jgi:hypothetical protein
MGGRGAGCVSGGAGAGFATDLQKGREVAAVAVMQGPHVSLRRLRLGPATSGARSLGGPPAAQIRHRTTAGRDFTHSTFPLDDRTLATQTPCPPSSLARPFAPPRASAPRLQPADGPAPPLRKRGSPASRLSRPERSATRSSMYVVDCRREGGT